MDFTCRLLVSWLEGFLPFLAVYLRFGCSLFRFLLFGFFFLFVLLCLVLVSKENF